MVVNGEKLAHRILRKIKEKLRRADLNLQLDMLYIEKNSASETFIRKKEEAAEKVGIKVNVHKLVKGKSKEVIKATCNRLNNDPNCTGFLVQLPINKSLDRDNILDLINPAKDVDCLSSLTLGRTLKGVRNAIRPATVEAIIHILNQLKVKLRSEVVTIVNDSNLIGKPLAAYLLSKGASVIICNEFTKNLANFTKQADILVTATGKAGLITADMVQKGSCIIDAGISKVKGKTVGDTDFNSVSKIAKVITPVPGGVGPLTVACLMQNLLKIYESQKKRPKNQ